MKKLNEQVGERKFLVGFSKLFPNEKPLTLKDYLSGFSRKDVLHAATFLIGIKTRGSEYENNHNFLSRWFNQENTRFFQDLSYRLASFEQESAIPVVILNPISSLRIFEFAFQELNDNDITNDCDLEVKLIKAYLVLNESITDLEYLSSESVKTLDVKIKWASFNICSKFFIYEFLHYYLGEISITQVIKSIHLFEFLSSNDDLKWLLDSFLNFYGHTDWKSYLKSYLPLSKSLLTMPKEGYLEIIVKKDINYETNCNFLDKFIIQNGQTLDDSDFRSVRANPLYKVEEGMYRVIYDLFVIEKVFTGIYFKLSEIYNNSERDQKNLGEFRGFYTSKFCENYLLYRTLKSCFPKKYIHITGEELKREGLSSEPDYYIRNKNKVFLFENKDVLIPAEIKQSCDYSRLEPELKKRFYYEENNGRIKNGAVLQLIHNIKLLLTSNFTPDSEVKKDFVSVYPILVLHYNQYNTPGLNQLLNYWFQIELKKRKNLASLKHDSFSIESVDQVLEHVH